MASPGPRRAMSYRKPVPKFEPSPPPSPAPSLPPVELQLLQVTDQLLSLPLSWSRSHSHEHRAPPSAMERDADLLVPSMISQGHLQVPGRRAVTPSSCLSVPLRKGDSRDPKGSSNVSRRENVSRGSESQWEGEVTIVDDAQDGLDPQMTPDRKRRKLHREYRPPTPPLPARHKRRRLTVTTEPEEHIVLRAVSSDVHVCSRSGDTTGSRAERERSLRAAPSFATEKTFVSLGAAAPTVGSSGWSGGLTTFVSESDPRLSSYPYPLPVYNPPYTLKAFSHLEFDKSEYQAQPPKSTATWLCDNLTSLGAGLKRFMIIFCC